MLTIIVLVLSGLAGGMWTYFCSTRLRQGPVRSSALSSLLVAGFFYCFPEVLSSYLSRHIPLVFLGASFIGMVSASQLSTYLGIALASLVFTVIYLNTSKFFDGYGGATGTSACIALLVVLSMPYLKSRKKLTVGFLQLRKVVLKKDKKSGIRRPDRPLRPDK